MLNKIGVSKIGVSKLGTSKLEDRNLSEAEVQKKIKQKQEALSSALQQYQKESGEYEEQVTRSADDIFDEAILGKEEEEYRQSALNVRQKTEDFASFLSKRGYSTDSLSKLGAGIKEEQEYAIAKKEYYGALKSGSVQDIEREKREFEKESTEYGQTIPNFSSLQAERQQLGEEATASIELLKGLDEFTPTGTYDERADAIETFASGLPGLKKENSYFASRRVMRMMQEGQKPGQDLTALGYDISDMQGLTEEAKYIPAIPGTNVQYFITNKGRMRASDYHSLSHGDRQSINVLGEEWQVEGGVGEQWIGQDPTKKFIKISQNGKTIIKSKPGQYVSSRSDGVERFGEFTEYEMELDTSGNILSETAYQPFLTQSAQYRGGGSDFIYGVSAAKKATYSQGKLANISKFGQLGSSISGGQGYTFGNYDISKSADVMFESGKLSKRDEFGDYVSSYEGYYGSSPDPTTWKQTGIGKVRTKDYRAGTIEYFPLTNASLSSDFGLKRYKDAVVKAGYVKDRKQFNAFDIGMAMKRNKDVSASNRKQAQYGTAIKFFNKIGKSSLLSGINWNKKQNFNF